MKSKNSKHPSKKYKQGSDLDNGVCMALGGGNWAKTQTHTHTFGARCELSKLIGNRINENKSNNKKELIQKIKRDTVTTASKSTNIIEHQNKNYSRNNNANREERHKLRERKPK